MTYASIEPYERVSALVDGQLQGDALAQALTELANDPAARHKWDVYHMVGEVMRNNNVRTSASDAEFVLRLRQRIGQPVLPIVADTLPIDDTNGEVPKVQSANDGAWRIVAGFSLVALLAWQGVVWMAPSDTNLNSQLARQSGSNELPTPTVNQAAVRQGSVLARQPLVRQDGSSALSIAAADPQVMIRDPHLDALLTAHRQYGGASVLPMNSGFLRNATFAETER